ncbi:MAG: ATP-dependent helicase [Chitinivibrionales bacterium]|nr:ATP-dependent helicase [Chitinivibrionales bacterium]
MPVPPFTDAEIKEYAFPAVFHAGKTCFEKGRQLKKLQVIGSDVVACFKGDPDITAVISKKPGKSFQSTCSCNFTFGGVCEHVVAAMLAYNAQQAVQIGLAFEDIATDHPRPSQQRPIVAAQPVAHEETPIASGKTVAQKGSAAVRSEDLFAQTGPVQIETINGLPRGRIYVHECDGRLIVEIRFAYFDGKVEVLRRDNSHEKLFTDAHGTAYRIVRSKARENALVLKLAQFGLEVYGSGTYMPAGDSFDWVQNEIHDVAAAGFEIFGRESLRVFNVHQAQPTLSTASRSVGSFIECVFDIQCDGISATLQELIDAIESQSTYIRLADGTTAVIPDEWIDKLTDLLSVAECNCEDNLIVIQRVNSAALDLLDSIALRSSAAGNGASGKNDAEDFNGVAGKQVPKSFAGALRPYQQAGYEWLYCLQELNYSGCLADDMGLGKTVQTIALLLNEKLKPADIKTSLLILPTSLIFNWEREIAKFAPQLLVMKYHGPGRKKYDTSIMQTADVIVTTYGTALRDARFLSEIAFNYIILDEAQAIKNPLSGVSKGLRELNSRHRLALSGTPIENNLSELWSLFTFLNPGMLGTYRHFVKHFAKPIESDNTSSKADLLQKLIKPCILRRTKSQVAKDLPPKTEMVLFAPMLPRQQTMYDITRQTFRGQLLREIDQQGIEKSRMDILAGLMKLRQICCHPALVDPAFRGDSGKFRLLDTCLEDIIGGGHKVLIFSPFVKALNLVKRHLQDLSIAHVMLTGETQNRQKAVDDFQKKDDIPVFLISLKAGGTGLNLTAADYVIHLDPWWNPAVENQASDRAYRIGQTRQVFVFKFITQDSVEERVLQLQEHKKSLFEKIIKTEATIFKELTKQDVLTLFD